MLQYDRKKVGEHLRMCRERANLTQAHVADSLGYTSPQFISNIERGISVAPLPLLARVMRLYKADVKPLEKIILSSQEALLLAKLKMDTKKRDMKKEDSKR